MKGWLINYRVSDLRPRAWKHGIKFGKYTVWEYIYMYMYIIT